MWRQDRGQIGKTKSEDSPNKLTLKPEENLIKHSLLHLNVCGCPCLGSLLTCSLAHLLSQSHAQFGSESKALPSSQALNMGNRHRLSRCKATVLLLVELEERPDSPRPPSIHPYETSTAVCSLQQSPRLQVEKVARGKVACSSERERERGIQRRPNLNLFKLQFPPLQNDISILAANLNSKFQEFGRFDRARMRERERERERDRALKVRISLV